MQHFFLSAATVASLFGSAVTSPANSSGIETSSGTILGHPASNSSHVTEFLGIRYAEAPVGELRFAAPKKFEASPDTVFEASEWVGTPHTATPEAHANSCSRRMF